MSRQIALAPWGAFLAVLAYSYWLGGMEHYVRPAGLESKLDQIVHVSSEHLVPCAWIAARRPIVILALGQSNAANHGDRAPEAGAPVTLIADGKCLMAGDPLPGSTGSGGSIWLRLPRHLSKLEPQRLLVLSVMGVDATSMQDWTGDKSPLRERLVTHLNSMQAMGLPPQLVLWQQGESDARLGTTETAYSAGLDKLASILDQAGSNAPIVMARSTVCRSAPYAAIRAAMKAKAERSARFQLGPDTDTLMGASLRHDGCHFSVEGLDRAAQLWGSTIGHLVPRG